MKKKTRILFTAFEAEPFVKTGGLGDVAGSLPRALQKQGVEVRVILPKLGQIPQRYRDEMTHLTDFTTDLGWRRQYVGIETLVHDGVRFYFIDNEYYFRRERAYGYMDDGERVAFFSKAVLDAIPLLSWDVDVIHCNDWHTALIPVLYRDRYSGQLPNIKTVFTIHNLRFQGVCGEDFAGDVLGMSRERAAQLGLLGENVNFLRGALYCSDALTTVSPTYAEEICTEYFGERMDGIFRLRRGSLTGILNGIDTEKLDPAVDVSLPANYSRQDKSGKAICKAALQQELGLAVREDVPLMVLVSRLTEQKGLDLLLRILEELMQEDCQLAVLGTGYAAYEEAFREAAGRHPGKLAAVLRFDAKLSNRMYAGADLALVPSIFEPCGLTQMMAMRYGAIPVVRETGGLKDSVEPYNRYTGTGTGFSFANINAHELLFQLKDAIALYRNEPAAWKALVDRAMEKDFSWLTSAGKYLELYESLMKRR